MLIRIERIRGTVSSSFLKYLDDTSDMYAFMLANVGVTPTFGTKPVVTADHKAKENK